MCSPSIPQAPSLCAFERPRPHVLEEERAQCFEGGLVNGGQKATQGRAMRKLASPEQRHEGGRGQEAIGERFEGRFTAQRIADATAPNDRTDVRARRLYAPPPVSGVLPDIVSCDKNECFCAPRWVIGSS